jgi:hypothetical protein
MPIDGLTAAPGTAITDPLAARRILRLAFGTALCLLFSQLAAWPLSFIAPILTLTVLALPLPAPPLKLGLGLVVGLLLPMLGGLAILTLMESARWAGILLISLALYHSFLFTARGGPAALGTFITMGLTVTVTIGTVSPTLLTILAQALAAGAVVGVLFVWVAHALLPDGPAVPRGLPKKAPAAPVDPAEARRSAFRALLIVLPVALAFMYMSASAAYTVIMIKVATMGQQASVDQSRDMGRSLIASTFWGGLAAIAAWGLLCVWPSLVLYVLLVLLAGLLFGRRIFSGASMHPEFSKWSYAYVTMLIVLGPSVLDSPISSGAGSAFWSRLLNFMFIGVYGSVAVAVFDAFWPKRTN